MEKIVRDKASITAAKNTCFYMQRDVIKKRDVRHKSSKGVDSTVAHL